MKKLYYLYITRVAGLVALFGLALWKNRFSYPLKSTKWRISKSLVDWGIVVSSALYLPALLVGWTVTCLTRGVKSRGIQITLAIISGIILSSISGVALELLCIFGIFSVDLLTGANGLYGWWTQRIPDNFLPRLRGSGLDTPIQQTTQRDTYS